MVKFIFFIVLCIIIIKFLNDLKKLKLKILENEKIYNSLKIEYNNLKVGYEKVKITYDNLLKEKKNLENTLNLEIIKNLNETKLFKEECEKKFAKKRKVWLDELTRKKEDLDNKKEEYEKSILENEKERKNLEFKESLLNYKLNSTMLKIYNDFYEKYLNEYIDFFSTKKNPSIKSSEYLKEIKTEFKETKIKTLKLELLLSQFIDDEIEKEKLKSEKEKNILDDSFSAHIYSQLSKEEWNRLTYIEKLDLIVKKYKERQKDKLNIGLEFERYCGYLYENEGYSVKYNGILKGKSDGGIDLIATKKDKILFIQCKYWGKDKMIRENTISQVYGSALKMSLDRGENYKSFIDKLFSKNIEILILTKTILSEEAKEFCEKLNVSFKENIEINQEYPIIKCVYGEEKIFYIPTDFQYDNIRFGSTYKKYSRVDSCKKASELGYRHAFRWQGN